MGGFINYLRVFPFSISRNLCSRPYIPQVILKLYYMQLARYNVNRLRYNILILPCKHTTLQRDILSHSIRNRAAMSRGLRWHRVQSTSVYRSCEGAARGSGPPAVHPLRVPPVRHNWLIAPAFLPSPSVDYSLPFAINLH